MFANSFSRVLHALNIIIISFTNLGFTNKNLQSKLLSHVKLFKKVNQSLLVHKSNRFIIELLKGLKVQIQVTSKVLKFLKT